jgi:hypothetical protein
MGTFQEKFRQFESVLNVSTVAKIKIKQMGTFQDKLRQFESVLKV